MKLCHVVEVSAIYQLLSSQDLRSLYGKLSELVMVMGNMRAFLKGFTATVAMTEDMSRKLSAMETSNNDILSDVQDLSMDRVPAIMVSSSLIVLLNSH